MTERRKAMKIENEVMLESAAKIFKLEPSNASFGAKNGFVCLTVNENGADRYYDRVFLHRTFPHELFYQYISVMEEDGKEIGLIYDIEDFDEHTSELLKDEMAKKYYSPVVIEIKSLKERYGFSYWQAVTEDGRNISFTMRDTFKNILHTGDDSVVLVDVDGNRFTIKSISGLSVRSYRKIELYL